MLACFGISFGSGFLSSFSCLFFAIFQLVTVLKSLTDYNNHEYLYSVISLFLALTDAHPIIIPKDLDSYNFGVFLAVFGTGYMLLWNVIYGIAGDIAVFGMCSIFIGVSLMLGSVERAKFPAIPRFSYWIFQILIGSVYFFAGVAKMDGDWLSGSTIRELYQGWIGPTALRPVLETIFRQEWPLIWIAYSGMFFDLMVPFGLVAPHFSIRLVFTCLSLGFHIMNHFTFVIETFPWVMITALVIYFDCDCIFFLSRTFQKMCSALKSIPPSGCLPSWKTFTLCGLLFILGVHLFIALPCATFTLQGVEAINFSSQCQFFSWRMMTRSSKLFTFLVYLKNDITNEIDPIVLSQFQLSTEEISSISIHEDYLHQTALRIKEMAISASPSANHIPPIVMADIWVQINGPPIQRYVIPSIDLTLGPKPSSLKLWLASLQFRPQPTTYPWQEERIQKYYTPYWKEVFQNITKDELELIGTGESFDTGSSVNQLLFFADRSGPERILVLFAKESSLLRVLAGQIFLQGLGTVSSGECLLVQGYIQITVRTMRENQQYDDTSLWMVRDRNHSIVVLPKYSSSKKYSPLRIFDRYSCPLAPTLGNFIANKDQKDLYLYNFLH